MAPSANPVKRLSSTYCVQASVPWPVQARDAPSSGRSPTQTPITGTVGPGVGGPAMWVNTFAGENGPCNSADLSTSKNEHELLHQPSFLNARKLHRSRMFQESPREVTVDAISPDPVHFQPSGNPVSSRPETPSILPVCSRWRAGRLRLSEAQNSLTKQHFSLSVKGLLRMQNSYYRPSVSTLLTP